MSQESIHKGQTLQFWLWTFCAVLWFGLCSQDWNLRWGGEGI